MKFLILFRKLKSKVVCLIPLLLTVLLTSCASKPQVVHCPVLPVAYIAHLDKTPFNGVSYGDVAQYAVILKRERDVCLNRLDKIREWQIENAQH